MISFRSFNQPEEMVYVAWALSPSGPLGSGPAGWRPRPGRLDISPSAIQGPTVYACPYVGRGIFNSIACKRGELLLPPAFTMFFGMPDRLREHVRRIGVEGFLWAGSSPGEALFVSCSWRDGCRCSSAEGHMLRAPEE